LTRRSDDSVNLSEDVLYPVIEFRHQHFFVCLGKLSTRDIPGDFRGTHDPASAFLTGEIVSE
jgi:hypothetical protein